MGPCNNIDHYQGECSDCLDGWYWAIEFCDQMGRIMLEYFCEEWHFEFVCAELCPNYG
jgi:hypothetical protein